MDYTFFHLVLEKLEPFISPQQRNVLREWIHFCKANGIHPLDYDPAKFPFPIRKHTALSLWMYLNFIRDNIYDCPEFQQRWMVLFNLLYDPAWVPSEPLMQIPDVTLALPPHLSDQPVFSPPGHQVLTPTIVPVQPPWQSSRRGGYLMSHRPFVCGCGCDGDRAQHVEDMEYLIDSMAGAYYDQANTLDIMRVGYEFIDWAVDAIGDPLHLNRDSAAFFIASYDEARTLKTRKFVWHSLLFILQHMMANSPNPTDYLGWWESYKRSSLETYEKAREETMQMLMEDAIRFLFQEGFTSNQIAHLTYKSLMGDFTTLPDVLNRYILAKSGSDTDRVFPLTIYEINLLKT